MLSWSIFPSEISEDKEERVLAVVSKPAMMKMIAWPMMMRLMRVMIIRMVIMKVMMAMAKMLPWLVMMRLIILRMVKMKMTAWPMICSKMREGSSLPLRASLVARLT